jgi:hypothetical protein
VKKGEADGEGEEEGEETAGFSGTVSPPGAAKSSEPIRAQGHKEAKKDSAPGPVPSTGWWEKQKEPRVSYLTVTIIVAILLGFIGVLAVGTGVLWDRWTDELGKHEETRGRAERAEGRERGVMSERDRLRQEITDLRKKNTELESPRLKFYGTRAKIISSYDLPKEAGASLVFGNCPEVPCFLFTIDDIHKTLEGIDHASMTMEGVWDERELTPFKMGFLLSLKVGCTSTFTASVLEVTFAVESVQYASVRVGIGISLAPSSQEGVKLLDTGCPEE